ncbi:flagella synthesis protein FlgN [Azonexus sp. IMCC34839]|uniref:flagella synthesis protein FlgN n=1 Tax=Azonexus sp. IMCC34839 TaxID=3133695 RepID=UPI00399BF09F
MSNLVLLLGKELELLDEFILLLAEEQNALKCGQTESLPELAEKKNQRIQVLNDLDNELRQTVGNISRSSESAPIDWPIPQEERDTVAPLWRALLEKARHAKQLNALNTQLVDMHLRNAKELLASLIPAADAGPLYGSNGQANGNTGSRIIDLA